MKPNGADLLGDARAVLLDALDALQECRAAVVVIGAQAIYLHTGGSALAVAEATKETDSSSTHGSSQPILGSGTR